MSKETIMSIFYQNHNQRLLFYTSDDNTYASHLHKQTELLVVLEGSITVTVDYASYTLTTDMGAIIFPNQLHSLITNGHSKILLCIFDVGLCHSYQKYFKYDLPSDNHFTLESMSAHSRIALMGLLRLTRDFQRGTPIPGSVFAYAEGYLTLFLADLFLVLPLKGKSAPDDLDLEQRVLLFLDSHFTENLSLDMLSKEFGVSRFTLSRLFSDKLHTGFPSYVNAKRLEYAKDLLSSTGLAVTQIALEAGFGSSRTFFREFQGAFHTTPADYRRNHPPRP